MRYYKTVNFYIYSEKPLYYIYIYIYRFYTIPLYIYTYNIYYIYTIYHIYYIYMYIYIRMHLPKYFKSGFTLYTLELLQRIRQWWMPYNKILRISPYSVRMRENTDQNNSEYGHFWRSVTCYISLSDQIFMPV